MQSLLIKTRRDVDRVFVVLLIAPVECLFNCLNVLSLRHVKVSFDVHFNIRSSFRFTLTHFYSQLFQLLRNVYRLQPGVLSDLINRTSVSWVLFQQLFYQVFTSLAYAFRLLIQAFLYFIVQHDLRGCAVRKLPLHHEVQYDAESPKINWLTFIKFFVNNLGSHVGRRATEHGQFGTMSHISSESEVNQPNLPFMINKYVISFEVSVNDEIRMEIVQSVNKLAKDKPDLRLIRQLLVLDHIFQTLSLEKFKIQNQAALALLVIKKLYDRLVLDLLQDLDLCQSVGESLLTHSLLAVKFGGYLPSLFLDQINCPERTFSDLSDYLDARFERALRLLRAHSKQVQTLVSERPWDPLKPDAFIASLFE